MSRDPHHSLGLDVLAREPADEDEIAEQSARERLAELEAAALMKDNLLALEMRNIRTVLTNRADRMITLLEQLVSQGRGKNGHKP